MKRTERLELDQLSLEAYGTASAWKKLWKRGVPSKITEKYLTFEKTYQSIRFLDLDEVREKMIRDLAAKKEEEAKKEAQKKRDEELKVQNEPKAEETVNV